MPKLPKPSGGPKVNISASVKPASSGLEKPKEPSMFRKLAATRAPKLGGVAGGAESGMKSPKMGGSKPPKIGGY